MSSTCAILRGILFTIAATGAASLASAQTAQISGHITDAATGLAAVQVPPGLSVQAYDSKGALVTSTGLDTAGGYQFTTLQPGTYFVKVRATNDPYVSQLFAGIPCESSDCRPIDGTPIVVTAGTTQMADVALEAEGKIAGRVTEQATGAAVGSVWMRLFNSRGAEMAANAPVTTGSDGTYTFRHLPADTYFLAVATPSFTSLPVIYNGVSCRLSSNVFVNGPSCPVLSGTPIVVAAGTTAAIDVAVPPGGAISGTIRTAAGTPLPFRVTVVISAGQFVARGLTAADGTYSIGGLPTGVYAVKADTANPLAPRYYDARCSMSVPSCGAQPSPVTVTGGTTTSGIDITLLPSELGSISGVISCTGTLTFDSSYVDVGVYDSAGRGVAGAGFGPFHLSCGSTYTIQVPPGTYYVSTTTFASTAGVSPTHSGAGGLVGEAFDDVPCVSTDCDPTRGTPVTVGVGEAVTGVNFTLQQGGSFSGSLSPIFFGACTVEVFDARGQKLEGRVRIYASCNSYDVIGLPEGVYFARTVRGGFSQAYHNACASCPPTSWTPIVVHLDQNTPGIDFTLPQEFRSVSGTIRNSGAAPLANINVELLTASGTIVGAAVTDLAGTYGINELTPGTYYARTRNTRGFVDKRYNDISCGECGVPGSTPIVVPAGSDVTGIDFVLAAGAQLRGTIGDAGGLPLPGARVSIFNAAGTVVARSTADGLGGYEAGVSPGTYFARTDPFAGYRQQLYRDLACPGGSCDPRSGSAISVAAPVNGVDFKLTSCSALSLAPATLAPMAVGLVYRQALSASGGTGSLTYAVAGGSLPAGLTLNSSTGVISGTPTASSSAAVTISVADEGGCATTRTYRADVSSCSLTVSLSSVAFIPTAPGPGLLRIDAGPDYLALPAAGGRDDVSLLGNCDPSAAFAAATVSDPWLHVIGPSVVNGQPQAAGQINVDANPSATRGRTGYVTINGRVITVRQAAIASASPVGVFDLPREGATVTGSVPVSGWALDDLGVSRIRIFRASVPPEAPGVLVFIGDGSFVRGARPDVERFYRSTPNSDRAGWGYLLLSNVLPNQGNGTFTLYAFADDPEGHSVLLGTKQITADNAHATVPFGTIDTPAEGATISGSAYVSFGWALTPQPKLIPTDGSTVQISIDSQIIGTVDYNHFRQDIFNTFPTLANANGAVGLRILDTTQLNDGMHTIGWLVTDNQGAAAGIGSRYFTVQNNGVSSSLTASVGDAIAAGARVDAGRRAASLASLPAAQRRVVVARPLERIEFTLDFTALEGTCAPTYAGYDASSGELRALPVGSSFDGATGQFQWQPGPGFIGTYELLFVRTSCDGTRERVPVRVVISAR